MKLEKGDIIVIQNKNQTYTSKPRPAIVYQNSLFGKKVESVTIVPISSTLLDAEPFRITLLPNIKNGLIKPSQAMTDKLTTIHKSDIDKKIGIISNLQLQKIDDAIKIWLGID